MMSQATAGVDAKYVAAAGQPGPHRIQLSVFAQQSLLGSFRPLVLKGSHAKTLPKPNTKADAIAKSLHHALEFRARRWGHKSH